jgi:hypothetical protein
MFAVNHLAHYLLASMAEISRMIITTSDTHGTRMAPTTLAPQALARPGKTGFGTGMRANAASKLCNLLTA